MIGIQSIAGSEGVVQTAIRLPVSLREKLRIEAKALGRSLNTHIVMRLGQGDEAAAGDTGIQTHVPAAE